MMAKCSLIPPGFFAIDSKYIEFVNSDEMIPFVNPYQRFGYWIWAAITAVIVFSRTVL